MQRQARVITIPGPRWRFWGLGDPGNRLDVNNVGTQLLCAWQSCCRFRVVVRQLNKMAALVMAAIDQTPRACGGVPAYALMNNENGRNRAGQKLLLNNQKRFAVPGDGDNIPTGGQCNNGLCTHRKG